MNEVQIGGRTLGPNHTPLVVAEFGLSHLGDPKTASQAVNKARGMAIEAIRYQCHVPEAEHHASLMPEHVASSVERGALTLADELKIREHARELGVLYITTPFSLAALDRLRPASGRPWSSTRLTKALWRLAALARPTGTGLALPFPVYG